MTAEAMLNHLLGLVAITLTTCSAHADEPTIVDACLRAVAIEMKAETIKGEDVQAFTELSPPRAQLTAVYTVTIEPDGIAKTLGAKPSQHGRSLDVRCSFASATAPFELSEMTCPSFECHVSPERLEELRERLRREGL